MFQIFNPGGWQQVFQYKGKKVISIAAPFENILKNSRFLAFETNSCELSQIALFSNFTALWMNSLKISPRLTKLIDNADDNVVLHTK